MSRRSKSNKSGKSRRVLHRRSSDLHMTEFSQPAATIALWLISGSISLVVLISLLDMVFNNG